MVEPIFWFRDYWSNRLPLARNILGDISDTEGEPPPSELSINESDSGKYELKSNDDPEITKYDVINPFPLVDKLEPYAIALESTELRRIPLGKLSELSALHFLDRLFVGPPKNMFSRLYFYDSKMSTKKHYLIEKDVPNWIKDDTWYWVIRFIYHWPYTVTLPTKLLRGISPSRTDFIHDDYERVDIWINAQTELIEWIVTDYHWRELWYDVDEKIERIYLEVRLNFHTLVPITVNNFIGEEITRNNPWEKYKRKRRILQRDRGYEQLFSKLGAGRALKFFPFSYVRYPRGNDSEIYRDHANNAME